MEYEEFFKEWINQARDYPAKALLKVALKEYQRQDHLLELFQGKLDGQSWSRHQWGQALKEKK